MGRRTSAHRRAQKNETAESEKPTAVVRADAWKNLNTIREVIGYDVMRQPECSKLRGLLGDYEKLKKDEIAHFGGSAAGMILKVPSQSYCSSDIGIENSMRSLIIVDEPLGNDIGILSPQASRIFECDLLPKRKIAELLHLRKQEIVNESWGNPFLLASLRRNYLKSEVGAKDLRRLKPLDSMSSMDGIDARWVNDEIITAYSVMINSRSDDEDVRMKKVGDENRNDGLLKAFCFTSFFYCKINGTANPKGVERWTKHVNIFNKDIIIVPINSNRHWLCASIDFRNKTIQVYDSLYSSQSEHDTIYANLRQYLEKESLDKTKVSFNFNGWVDIKMDSLDTSVPQQKNEFDCGIFLCQFMESLSREGDGFDFDATHMPYFRNKIAYEIITSSLMTEPLEVV